VTEVGFWRCAIKQCGVPPNKRKGPDVAKCGQVREGEVQVLWVDPWQETVLLQGQRTRVGSGSVDVLRGVLEPGPAAEIGRVEMDGFKEVGLAPGSPSL